MHVVPLSKIQRHLKYRVADLNRSKLLRSAYDSIYRENEEDVADLVFKSIMCGVRLGLYFDSMAFPKTVSAK